jgi:transposase
VPAVPSSIIEPLWDQVAVLLPARDVVHPRGCHRARIPDRLVFDTLVQVLVVGCASHRVADEAVSATTLRRRRDEWITLGIMDTLPDRALAADDRMIGLARGDLSVDGCITTAPGGGELAGRRPVDRGTQGRKRSLAVDAASIPLGTVVGPANRHDAPLREPPVDAVAVADDGMTVHLDRGDDARRTRTLLAARGMTAASAVRGTPAPITAGQRWVVERTNAWTTAHTTLVWCPERRAAVVALWIRVSAVMIIVGRLVREGWMRYRWATRPSRRP